jgi:hypothetical protein
VTVSSVTCVKCGKAFAASVAVCPFCGQRRADFTPAQPPITGAHRLTPLPPSGSTPAAVGVAPVAASASFSGGTPMVPQPVPLAGARGTPLPGARGTPLPGARGTPLPGARGTPLPGARGTPLPGARGTPLPGARGTPLPPGAAIGNCFKCNSPIRSQNGICGRCGWDGARARRACLRCGSLVTLNVRGLSLGLQGAGVAAIAITVGFFFGFLGALALALALAAIGSGIHAQGAGYRCESCGQELPPRYVSSSERSELKEEQLRYRIGALVMAVLCAGAVALLAYLLVANGKTARTVVPAAPLGASQQNTPASVPAK